MTITTCLILPEASRWNRAAGGATCGTFATGSPGAIAPLLLLLHAASANPIAAIAKDSRARRTSGIRHPPLPLFRVRYVVIRRLTFETVRVVLRLNRHELARQLQEIEGILRR